MRNSWSPPVASANRRDAADRRAPAVSAHAAPATRRTRRAAVGSLHPMTEPQTCKSLARSPWPSCDRHTLDFSRVRKPTAIPRSPAAMRAAHVRAVSAGGGTHGRSPAIGTIGEDAGVPPVQPDRGRAVAPYGEAIDQRRPWARTQTRAPAPPIRSPMPRHSLPGATHHAPAALPSRPPPAAAGTPPCGRR